MSPSYLGGMNCSDPLAATKSDEAIKTYFTVREGTYRQMSASEYLRPSRMAPYSSGIGGASGGMGGTGGLGGVSSAGSHLSQNNNSPPCKLSFLSVPYQSSSSYDSANSSTTITCDRVAFNMGRELFIYPFRGTRKGADLTKPIDKRVYKGTLPTCHDWNSVGATVDSALLIVGFSAGQIQLIDPIKKDISRLYNEDRLIDKSKVTCIRWVPGSRQQFVVSYSSGHLYLFKEDLVCGTTPPTYQTFKSGDGYSVYTCKTKSTRNPLYRWEIGRGAINEFAFSPCSQYLATVSQDGFLRVFNFDTMELIGRMRSYFGGIICVTWSPDSRYAVTGGEDDLITVWSLNEKRVVARGQGHKSWISSVVFDPFNSLGAQDPSHHQSLMNRKCDHYTSDEHLMDNMSKYCNVTTGKDGSSVSATCTSTLMMRSQRTGSTSSGIGSRSGGGGLPNGPVSSAHIPLTSSSSISSAHLNSAIGHATLSYRLASVGLDACICFWDLTDDVLRPRSAVVTAPGSSFGGRSRASLQLSSSPSFHTATTAVNSSLTSNHVANSLSNHLMINNSSSAQSTNPFHASQQPPVSSDPHSFNSILDAKQQQQQQQAGENDTTSTNSSSNTGTLGKSKKEHKRNFSLGIVGRDKNSSDKGDKSGNKSNSNALVLNGGCNGGDPADPKHYIGTPMCPKLNDIPLLEPLIVKRISADRLTCVAFREDCFVVSCQEGFISTWSRPGKWHQNTSQSISSPSPSLVDDDDRDHHHNHHNRYDPVRSLPDENQDFSDDESGDPASHRTHLRRDIIGPGMRITKPESVV